MTYRDGLTPDDLDAAAVACGKAALLDNAERFEVIQAKLYAEAARRRALETR